MKLYVAVAAAALAPSALAWGAAGHEIVATIAQIHLHPAVKERLCGILPETAHCHLAPVAAWADTVRRWYPETGPMHYVNPKDDHPADMCTFGEHGWINEDVNVLTAIMNKTQVMIDKPNDIDLRFLVHFLGDLHQPLHLTGRLRGGNNAIFHFEGRTRSLHSTWDSGLITKTIRELGNYTTPVPSKQIESALPGAIFDPYVRWIVWEGLREWWREDIPDWISCPPKGDPYPHSAFGYPAPPPKPVWSDYAAHAAAFLPSNVHAFLSPILPVASELTRGVADMLLANHPTRLAETGETFSEPACPFTWAKDIHEVNCKYAWPKGWNESMPAQELDTDEYMGALSDAKVVESLLAMAGIRLAHILNSAIGGKPGVYVSY